jgi:DNA-binding response OmpR family regulator
MSDQSPRKPNTSSPGSQRSRRVLLVMPEKGSVLRSELIASGYETAATKPESTLAFVADYIPDVVIFELGGPVQESDQHILALARRLRSEASTYALPLVFCGHEDDRSIRNSLIGLGADDYFSITAPIKETLARLDSLFWRIETGRRSAASSGDQRLDIDNFMLLLDSVRDDIRSGLIGTVGLIYATSPPGGVQLDRSSRDRSLSETNGFLRLNIRRADSVTFYGPTTLLIYMPGVSLALANERLTTLHKQFRINNADRDFAAGLASFPVESNSLETVMERAEAGAGIARQPDAVNRVVATELNIGEEEPVAEPISPESTEPGSLPAPATAPDAAEAVEPETPVVIESTNQEIFDRPELEFDINLEDEIPDEVTPAGNSVIEPLESLETPRISPAFEGILAAGPPVQSNPEPIEPVFEEIAPAITGEPPPVETTERRVERKTFFEKGFDPIVTSEMTMADIMEKVAATRPRVVTETEPSTAPIHEAAARELHLRESGERMFRHLLLIVSDTKRMAALNSLVRGAGYEVRASFSGRQALDLLRLERPELIVIDYRLNAMDGLETIKRLRTQNGGRMTIPILMLAPEEEANVRNEAISLGVQKVMSSDYDPAELLSNIRTAENVL